MNLLPLFLDLRAKRVLLVGGGSVARDKLRALAGTGCQLRVVALHVSPAFLDLAQGLVLDLHRRRFRPSDLEGVHLVISATNDAAANARIAALARAKGLWVNAVDDPERCDALFASTLRRGPWTLAIGTAGAFPGLSRALREALEALLPAADEAELHQLAALRAALRRRHPDPATRSQALRDLVGAFARTYLSPSPSLASGDSHDPRPH
jgi:siroheme synthase-like protein